MLTTTACTRLQVQAWGVHATVGSWHVGWEPAQSSPPHLLASTCPCRSPAPSPHCWKAHTPSLSPRPHLKRRCLMASNSSPHLWLPWQQQTSSVG